MNDSVRTILEIVKKEFLQFRRDRRMVGMSILAPMLQVVLLGYAATTDITNAGLVVCDMDRSATSREVVREFTTSGYFIHRFSVDVATEVPQLFEQGDAIVALVIPPDFGNNILRHQQASLQLLVDGADANTATILLAYATQIVNAYGREVIASYSTVGTMGRVARVLPEPRIWFNPDMLSSNFMVPGVVALVLMITTMTLTSLGIVREKEIGTLEQLMVTPIRPYQLIAGKLIPFVVIGFVDVSIVLTIARYWFHVPLLGSVLLLFALSGLFILTTLGLGLFVSTIARSQQQAMMIAQFFLFMPFMFLSGFAIPIANMPPVIQYVTYVIPLRYFLEIVRGIFLKGIGLAQLWPQALALFAIGVSILGLSIMRFRKTLE
jgi:ABC-2 type transport system permease protein